MGLGWSCPYPVKATYGGITPVPSESEIILMEESTSSPDEINSAASFNKKRKSQNEPQELPLSKHVCCDRAPESDSSSDCESAKDSNTLQCHVDSAMSSDIEYELVVDSSESGYVEYNCSCSEYRNDGLENCVDSEIENLPYSKGVAPSNYALSPGRWPVNQDAQQESKKPTIDKEFEQHFSMLLL